MPRSLEQGPEIETSPEEEIEEFTPVTEEEQEKLRVRTAVYSKELGYLADSRDAIKSLEKTDPQAFQELKNIETRHRQEVISLQFPLFDYSVRKILDCAQPNSLGDSEKDLKVEKERRLSKLQSMLEHAVTWLHLPEEEKVSLRRREVDLSVTAFANESEDEKEERVNRAYIAIPGNIQHGQEQLLPKIEALEKTIEEVKGSM